MCVFASVLLTVGRKCVGFPHFLQGSTAHASGSPLCVRVYFLESMSFLVGRKGLDRFVPWPWWVCVRSEFFGLVSLLAGKKRVPPISAGVIASVSGSLKFQYGLPALGECPDAWFTSPRLAHQGSLLISHVSPGLVVRVLVHFSQHLFASEGSVSSHIYSYEQVK